PVDFQPGEVYLKPGGTLAATNVQVPGDFSSAAFFLVAASIVPGSDVCLRDIGLNPRRTGVLVVLRRMGADIRVENRHGVADEPRGALRVRHARLHGIRVPQGHVSDMIDEFPALFVAAALARGDTVITGAGELRVKESD